MNKEQFISYVNEVKDWVIIWSDTIPKEYEITEEIENYIIQYFSTNFKT